MIEILRRVVLIVGLCGAGWFWYSSPPLLISVREPDFQREYKRRFAWLSLEGEEGRGRISLEEYRRRTLATRKLPPPRGDVSGWLRDLEDAFQGRGTEARRVSEGAAYYLPGEAPVAQWVPALQEFYRNGSWLNAYLSAGGKDLEFMLHPEPRESKAPVWILFPERDRAWKWALAGLLLYLLLPGRARGPVRYDPVPVWAMDGAGAALVCFFWTLPLALHETNQAAVDNWLGPAGLSWLAAALVLALLIRNAANAAFELALAEDGIQIRRLWGRTAVPFAAVRAVEPLEDHGARAGLRLRLEGGGEADLPWGGVMNYVALADALEARGLYRPARQGEPG